MKCSHYILRSKGSFNYRAPPHNNITRGLFNIYNKQKKSGKQPAILTFRQLIYTYTHSYKMTVIVGDFHRLPPFK